MNGAQAEGNFYELQQHFAAGLTNSHGWNDPDGLNSIEGSKCMNILLAEQSSAIQ